MMRWFKCCNSVCQIQREAEEAQQMLSTHAGALQHTATQTATPYDSINTNTATSSGMLIR